MAATTSSQGQEPPSETFMLENEDHTLANALRFFLNKKYAACPNLLAVNGLTS